MRALLGLRQSRFGQDILVCSICSLHNGMALRVVGDDKGTAYSPGIKEFVELLGSISRAIISLYGTWHPHDQHGQFKSFNNTGGLFP